MKLSAGIEGNYRCYCGSEEFTEVSFEQVSFNKNQSIHNQKYRATYSCQQCEKKHAFNFDSPEDRKRFAR